jgi:hypothetical protein
MSDSSALSSTQVRAIAALTTCRTITAAATQARCGESTLRRWLAQDAAFQAAWREARARLVDEAISQATRSAQAAALVLHNLMMDAPSDAVRLGAAKALLELSLGWLERGVLEERIATLERMVSAYADQPV